MLANHSRDEEGVQRQLILSPGRRLSTMSALTLRTRRFEAEISLCDLVINSRLDW